MGISSDKILHKSTVHVKMEAQCFFCTQELPFGFLMVCQNCGIFQSLVQDMVKTCVEKFRRVPKNFVEAWNLFYKESEVKSPPRCRFQRQNLQIAQNQNHCRGQQHGLVRLPAYDKSGSFHS